MPHSSSFRQGIRKIGPLLKKVEKVDKTFFTSPHRLLSTKTKPWYYENPSQIISGTTTQDLDNDPELAIYFATNFPEPPPSIEQFHQQKLEQQLSADAEEDKEQKALLKLNIRPLLCHPRDKANEEGSRVCRRMREYDRMIPGIMYGDHPTTTADMKDKRILVKTPLSEVQRERDRYFHNFSSRVYNLTVQDPKTSDIISQQKVVPSDVNMHPVLNKAYCVNYLRYHPGRVLKLPIQYINEEESPALKRGGFIIPINRHVRVLVEDGVAIPESIELDCTGAHIKEKMRADRLIIPDGVKICKSVDLETFLIGPVAGRGIKADDENDEEDP